MPRKFVIILCLLLLIFSCDDDKSTQSTSEDLLARLEALSDMEVTEISPPSGYSRAFMVLVDQPLDHDNPSGAGFRQTFYISHLSETAPTVLHISGYGIVNNAIFETASLLEANQVYVGHRFFHGAEPDPLSWQYLNIEQSADDYHKIVSTLKQIYTGKWVSAGVSKGGMTTAFYRRFYPGDIDASICYVAPFPSGTEDPRFDAYIAQNGTQECRDDIKAYQRLVLQNRENILPLMEDYAEGSNFTFEFDYSLILEFCVLEYPFSFWQYGAGDCSIVPATGSSAQTLFGHLQYVVGMDYFSEEYFSYYQPFYYQAYTELGYYPLNDFGLEDLLVSDESHSYSILAPRGVDLAYNSAAMQDIVSWLVSSGDNMIYIYGANDPWTAGAIELNGAADAVRIIQPGENHGVKIADLDDKALVYSKLEEWLGIELNISASMNFPSGPMPKDAVKMIRR